MTNREIKIGDIGDPPEGVEVWWRCYGKVQLNGTYADEFGTFYSHRLTRPRVTIHWEWFEVKKHTPKGVKLIIPEDIDVSGRLESERFVGHSHRKKFACSTRGEALVSLQSRQRRRRGFLVHDLEACDVLLEYLDSKAGKEEEELSREDWRQDDDPFGE